ncbi:hypothetical protein BHM03_00004824 [Ensete ventricosum]|nr:hypothetical protein BHM03_00004824 [Ensete ventricosum]
MEVRSHRDVTRFHEEHAADLVVVRPVSLYICIDSVSMQMVVAATTSTVKMVVASLLTRCVDSSLDQKLGSLELLPLPSLLPTSNRFTSATEREWQELQRSQL